MKKAVLLGAVISAAGIVLYSCGGGGGGSSTSSTPPISPVTSSGEVTQATSSISTIIQTIPNVLPSRNSNGLGLMSNENSTVSSTKKNITDLVLSIPSRISKVSGQMRIQATSASGTANCPDGGTIQYSYSWTNPNCDLVSRTGCFDNNTINYTETYNDCKIGGYTFNGTGKGYVKYSGNTIEGHMETPSFSMINNYNDKYSLRYSNFSEDFSFTTDKYYTLTLNGKLNDITFNKFTITEEDYAVDQYHDPIDYKFTFNGGLSGVYNNKPFEYNTQNLSFYQKLEPGTWRATISINGYFYEGYCNKKWYYFKTLTNIVDYPNNSCPVEGELQINNSYSLVATQDGGLNIKNSQGQIEKSYQSCRDYENEAKQLVCQ